MLSATQGNYWYHFYNVFVMTGNWTWDLPLSKPALYHKAIEEAFDDDDDIKSSYRLGVEGKHSLKLRQKKAQL